MKVIETAKIIAARIRFFGLPPVALVLDISTLHVSDRVPARFRRSD
jgi:hypothetical protein